MEKNRQTVRVVDEHGTEIGYTYPKRAKGLVKKCRAEFVTDQEIRLYKSGPTYENMEEKEMDECKKINYITINPRNWYPDMEDPNTQDGFTNNNRSRTGITWDRFFISNPLAGALPSVPGMVEILSVGSWNWNVLTRVACVPWQLAPDTEYELMFWLNGGENDRSDETCNLEIFHLSEDTSQYSNRFCYRLNRSYIMPCKKYKGWEYYVIPFRTGSTGFIKLRLVADRAPMAVMAAETPEVYAELADVPDPFENKRPQRHNIVFADGWPTDKWYATETLAGTKQTSCSSNNSSRQEMTEGMEELNDRMDDLEEAMDDFNDHMSDLSDQITDLTERIRELTESLGQK